MLIPDDLKKSITMEYRNFKAIVSWSEDTKFSITFVTGPQKIGNVQHLESRKYALEYAGRLIDELSWLYATTYKGFKLSTRYNISYGSWEFQAIKRKSKNDTKDIITIHNHGFIYRDIALAAATSLISELSENLE